MTYRIDIKSSAERDLAGLPKAERQRIDQRILRLAEDPRPTGVVKLAGHANLYRIRVGTYRIIYAIADDTLIIVVTRVAHRKDVYRGM